MSSKSIYHYVYRITNTVEGKHYYGTRSSKIHPSKDLGKNYFSSSKDKDFIKDQKDNPQNYKYKVIRLFDSRKEVITFEIKLHDRFDVGVNESFYNRAKQTSVGWDTTGMVSVRDTVTGENLVCTNNDPNYISGRYVSITKGKLSVINIETGETLQCSVDDPNYISGMYVSVNKGNIPVKDTKTGLSFSCSRDDPNYISGRYVSTSMGTATVKDIETGEVFRCSVDDPKYLSGVYVSIMTGMVVVRDTKTGENLVCTNNDPNYISGRYVSVNKGRNQTEETKRKISESNKGIPKSKVKCKYCELEASAGTIGRWHNENCKQKIASCLL